MLQPEPPISQRELSLTSWVGKTQRYIELKPIVAFGLTLQSSWETIAVSFQTAFYNGGPVSLVYGIMIVTCGSAAIAASLGEMASIDPTVGAQYRWTARYAPRALNPLFWGLIQGWLTVLAWIANAALGPFGLATMLQALLVFNYPDTYDPKTWHVTLLDWALVLLTLFLNVSTSPPRNKRVLIKDCL